MRASLLLRRGVWREDIELFRVVWVLDLWGLESEFWRCNHREIGCGFREKNSA